MAGRRPWGSMIYPLRASGSGSSPRELERGLLALGSVARDVHFTLPTLPSQPFRARRSWRTHASIACNLLLCAELLRCLATSGASCLRSLPRACPALLNPEQSAGPLVALRALLAGLSWAEDLLRSCSTPASPVQAAFRTARAKVLRAFGLHLGSLLCACPRAVRDTGSNTDEIRVKNSGEDYDFFIFPAICTYATPAALRKFFGHHAVGKAYIGSARCAEELDLSDAGVAPRKCPEGVEGRRGFAKTIALGLVESEARGAAG